MKTRVQDFLENVTQQFTAPLEISNLLSLSKKLRSQFKDGLQQISSSMLPTFHHQAPTGDEQGTYLAVDVGGSVLRLALVQLYGRNLSEKPMKIIQMDNWRVDESVKALKSTAFFDWIALKIDLLVSKFQRPYFQIPPPISLGLAWSFPVEFVARNFTRLQELGLT